MSTAGDLLLGVDGGGTKTLAWVAADEPNAARQPLGCGESGPGNPRAVGFEQALANIGSAVDAALAATGRANVRFRSACLALAGADRPSERSRVESWAAERRLARQLLVTHDAAPILAAASPENCGVALIAGTGSFAFGRSSTGEVARCGGWGYLFGDEGSGYSIALSGLRAAARAADERGPRTLLLELYQQRLDAASPQVLIERVYRTDMPRQQIAELADVVFQAARMEDSAAIDVLTEAAHELSLLVETIAQRLQLPADAYALGMAGGVLVHQPAFRERVLRRLAKTRRPGDVTLVPEPVRGAVLLAQRAAL